MDVGLMDIRMSLNNEDVSCFYCTKELPQNIHSKWKIPIEKKYDVG
jgi:hypothetical protein